MALELFQVVGILFCALMVYLTYLYYKRKNYSSLSFIVWTGVWIAGLLLVAFPVILSPLTTRLAFSRTFDLFTAFAVMFFSLVTFFNHIRVSRFERKVEDLVRAIAIREVRAPKKRK